MQVEDGTITAGPHAGQEQREMQRGGAGVGGDAEARADVARHRVFEVDAARSLAHPAGKDHLRGGPRLLLAQPWPQERDVIGKQIAHGL